MKRIDILACSIELLVMQSGFVSAQIYEGRAYSKADALFLTHHHSDHTVGIPELYLKDVDLLLHEVISPSNIEELNASIPSAVMVENIISIHTTAAQAL